MHENYNNNSLRFCFEGPKNLTNQKIDTLTDLIDAHLGLYGKTVRIEEEENSQIYMDFLKPLGKIIKSTPAFPFMMYLLNEQLSELFKRDKYKKYPLLLKMNAKKK